MRKVTLEIRAEDIRNTRYDRANECAITKALQRAGIDGRDCGFSIALNSNEKEIIDHRDPDYARLTRRVVAMYGYVRNIPEHLVNKANMEEPQDFSVELNLDID